MTGKFTRAVRYSLLIFLMAVTGYHCGTLTVGVVDMALYYNNLYMVASDSGQLLRMPKDGSLPVEIVGQVNSSQLLEEPFGVTVVFGKQSDSRIQVEI